MSYQTEYTAVIDQLTYEEKHAIHDSACDGCKAAMWALDSDCPYSCDGFYKEAVEMLAQRHEDKPEPVYSFPMFALFEVESIKLSRWEIPNGIKGVDIRISTRQGINLSMNCHQGHGQPVEIIDETQKKKPLLTPDELRDIEDARGPVAALCCETATLKHDDHGVMLVEIATPAKEEVFLNKLEGMMTDVEKEQAAALSVEAEVRP